MLGMVVVALKQRIQQEPKFSSTYDINQIAFFVELPAVTATAITLRQLKHSR
jgi:hypothetical protein